MDYIEDIIGTVSSPHAVSVDTLPRPTLRYAELPIRDTWTAIAPDFTARDIEELKDKIQYLTEEVDRLKSMRIYAERPLLQVLTKEDTENS